MPRPRTLGVLIGNTRTPAAEIRRECASEPPSDERLDTAIVRLADEYQGPLHAPSGRRAIVSAADVVQHGCGLQAQVERLKRLAG